MNYEYLVFNAVVIFGPFLASFWHRSRFVHEWPRVFLAVGIVLVPFIIWDALVTGRHWSFNPDYTLPLRILGLPLGEWLFFITVPFACVFVWEVLPDPARKNSPGAGGRQPAGNDNRDGAGSYPAVLKVLALVLPVAGCFLFWLGKEYTGIVVFVLGLCITVDRLLETRILPRKKSLVYAGIVIGLTFIFNSYLTARPVVLYGVDYQLDFRIGTIPVEDFGYGLALLFLCVMVYEKIGRARV